MKDFIDVVDVDSNVQMQFKWLKIAMIHRPLEALAGEVSFNACISAVSRALGRGALMIRDSIVMRLHQSQGNMMKSDDIWFEHIWNLCGWPISETETGGSSHPFGTWATDAYGAKRWMGWKITADRLFAHAHFGWTLAQSLAAFNQQWIKDSGSKKQPWQMETWTAFGPLWSAPLKEISKDIKSLNYLRKSDLVG